MKKLSLALLVSASLVSVNAFAHRGFIGANVVPNIGEKACQTCHVNSGGRSPWNTFGQELNDNQVTYYDGGQPNWPSICDEDFDGDGFSNGEELGDPSCTFPTVAAGAWESDPADKNSVPSNNANNGTTTGTTAGTTTGTTTGNGTTGTTNGTTGTTNATTAGNNGTTTGNTTTTGSTNNNSTTGGNNTTTGATDDGGCSSTGSNPGRFSLFFVLGLFYLGRKRRGSKK